MIGRTLSVNAPELIEGWYIDSEAQAEIRVAEFARIGVAAATPGVSRTVLVSFSLRSAPLKAKSTEEPDGCR